MCRSKDLTAVAWRARAAISLAIVNNSGNRRARSKEKSFTEREDKILILATKKQKKNSYNMVLAKGSINLWLLFRL